MVKSTLSNSSERYTTKIVIFRLSFCRFTYKPFKLNIFSGDTLTPLNHFRRNYHFKKRKSWRFQCSCGDRAKFFPPTSDITEHPSKTGSPKRLRLSHRNASSSVYESLIRMSLYGYKGDKLRQNFAVHLAWNKYGRIYVEETAIIHFRWAFTGGKLSLNIPNASNWFGSKVKINLKKKGRENIV